MCFTRFFLLRLRFLAHLHCSQHLSQHTLFHNEVNESKHKCASVAVFFLNVKWFKITFVVKAMERVCK